MGKPNRNRRSRAMAQALLQALAFKHLNPTRPSPRGRGHTTGPFEGVRNNCGRIIMPGYSLVPVDYQPDFDDYSLVPVDYDPFAADGVAQQSQIQQAQAAPQGPPQQQPATGAGQPDAGAPAAGGVADR
jgi:hypothetical protein